MPSFPDNEIISTVPSIDLSDNAKRSPTRMVEPQKDTTHLKKLMADLELSSSLDSDDQIDHALQSVVESAAFLTRSGFVSVIIKRADTAEWQLKARQGSLEPLLERTCNQIMLGVLTSVYEFDNVYMPNIDRLTVQDQTHYLMCVPLVRNRQILGGMLIVRANWKIDFTEQDIATAFLLGQWCSDRLAVFDTDENWEKEHLSNERFKSVLARNREEERQRIAADLHDGVAQWMLRVAYDIDECRTLLAIGETGNLKKSLAATKKTVQKCIHEVRRAIADLKPIPVSKYGLVGALSRKADELNVSGIHCVFKMESKLPYLNDIQEKTVFWISEEALNNVQKHAKAHSVTIRIGIESGSLQLTVSDDGKGFSKTESVQSDRSFLKNGLKGMEIRARQIGGSLTVDSKSGTGTTVKFVLPMAK